MISVCLATYNGEKYIEEMLNSIIPQLSSEDEIIISDDGSSDRTIEIVKKYSSLVRIVSCQRIGGVVKNFERALNAAKGDILILCDQDDVWEKNRISVIKKNLANNDLLILNGLVVDGNLKPTGKTIFESIGRERGFFNNYKKNTYIGCGMAFNRKIAKLALPFPAAVPWHDWYIGLIAELFGKVGDIEEITMKYRRHGGNVTETGGASKNSLPKILWMRVCILYCLTAVFYKKLSKINHKT